VGSNPAEGTILNFESQLDFYFFNYFLPNINSTFSKTAFLTCSVYISGNHFNAKFLFFNLLSKVTSAQIQYGIDCSKTTFCSSESNSTSATLFQSEYISTSIFESHSITSNLVFFITFHI